MNTFWDAIASGALRGGEPERKGCKITMRDDSLPHQIRQGFVPGGGHLMYVSCTCRGTRSGNGTPHYEPIESRTLWQPHEPIEVWRRHMAGVSAA